MVPHAVWWPLTFSIQWNLRLFYLLGVLPSLTTSVTHEEFPTTRGLGPETTNSLFYFKDKEIPTKTISPSPMQRNCGAGRLDAQSSFRGGIWGAGSQGVG